MMLALAAGKTIEALRKQRDISQATVAHAVGLTPSTWSRIESGKTVLTVDQLGAACRCIGVAPDEVIRIAASAEMQSFVKRRTRLESSLDEVTKEMLDVPLLKRHKD